MDKPRRVEHVEVLQQTLKSDMKKDSDWVTESSQAPVEEVPNTSDFKSEVVYTTDVHCYNKEPSVHEEEPSLSEQISEYDIKSMRPQGPPHKFNDWVEATEEPGQGGEKGPEKEVDTGLESNPADWKELSDCLRSEKKDQKYAGHHEEACDTVLDEAAAESDQDDQFKAQEEMASEVARSEHQESVEAAALSQKSEHSDVKRF